MEGATDVAPSPSSAELGLKFSLSFGSGGGFFEISQVKVRKLAAGFASGGAGMEGSVERAKRLAKFGRHRRDAAGGGREWGEMHAEGLGFGGKLT